MAKPGKTQISQQEVFDYLMSKPNMTRNKALGIMANIRAESDFYVDAVQMGDMEDENRGIGLFQHTYKSRKNGLKEKVPNWETNWKGQIDYALEEQESQNYMNTIYDSPEEATRAFMLEFEKPKDQSEENINKRSNYVDSLNIAPAPVQYQEVLGPDGNTIRIPIGESATQEDIKKAKKATETGEVVYSNWDEVYKDIDNIDKSLPITIGENKYKWASTTGSQEKEKGEGEFFLIDDDGEFKTRGGQRLTPFGIVDKEDPNYTQLLIQREAKSRAKKEKENLIKLEEDKAAPILDADYDGIPDTIDIDAGQGAPVGQETVSATGTETPEVIETTEEGQPSNRLQNLGGLAGNILKGAAGVLDGIGGPGAIISYMMGKKGLKAAMKEIVPQKRPELSPMFMQHMRQVKELSKKGFHPAEEIKFRKEIDNAYQHSLEKKVRGTGGDRAKFLAQTGILDAARSSALLDYAAKDAELQRKNQDRYEKMMLFKENYDIQRTEQDRLEDLERQVANKEAAINFTSAAFTNAMSGLNKTSVSGLVEKLLGATSGDGINVHNSEKY